jgi:hypothetical protein
MSSLLNFINHNKRQLVQIYTKERQESGIEGILWILETPENRANVSYIYINDIPDGLKNEIDNLKNENRSDSIIYFYVCDPLMAQIIQIDLRHFNPETAEMNFVNKPNITVIKNTYEQYKNSLATNVGNSENNLKSESDILKEKIQNTLDSVTNDIEVLNDYVSK